MSEAQTEGSVVRSTRRVPVEFGGEEHRGWLPAGAARPRATAVVKALLSIRILESAGGYLLEWEPEDGEAVPCEAPYAGDTWHETLDDAVEHAETVFGVPPDGWM